MRQPPIILDVRHGQTFLLAELQAECRALMSDKGLSQEKVGAMLEPPISQAAVSAALRPPDASGAEARPGTLMRIIEALTRGRYTVKEERTVEYRVLRTDRTPEA